MKTKLTAVLISFVLLISSFSGIFSAEEIEGYDDQVVYATDSPEEISDLIEIPEKKERYTNHYMKPDGSYLAVMYTEPVNYYTNGVWKEIDNSLVDALDRDNAKVLRNKSNDYIVEFPKTAQLGKLVNIKAGDHELSWNISSGIKNIAGKSAETVNSTKASSRIRYESAFQNVDIEYTTSATKVREDIVLNNPSTVTEFQFDILCKNLTAKLEDDNSVSFIDPEKPGEVVFTMEAPFMYDSSESADISYDIEVFFAETESGYSLVYRPDSTWLDSPERVYPVIIDPTIAVYSTRSSSAIADTYVHSGDAPGDHTLLTYLRVGNASDGLTRTFVKTDLPTITSGTVYSAKLLLSNTSGSSTFQNVDVYRMNSSWTSSGISWSSHLSLSKTLIASNIPASAYSNSPSAHRYVCDVTDTVQDFYSGTRTNYGFMVRYTNESIADYNAFYSSDCGTTDVMPCLYISYVYGQTSGIYNGSIYYLTNKNSSKYLNVAGAGTSNGTNVSQYDYIGATNQRWKIVYYGNGFYRLQAMNTTDKYLEVASYSNTNGVNIDISNLDISRQLWSILSNGDGSYRILSECSNLSKGLTVEGASTQSGANVFQYTYTGSGSDDNDDWYISLSREWPVTVEPTIKSRSDWGARTPDYNKMNIRTFTETRRIIFHHSANKFTSTDLTAVANEIKSLQDMHMDDDNYKFGDIGYHYLIDPAGRIWEGRQLQYEGAHSYGYNNDIGVCILGDFEQRIFNPFPDELNQQQKDAMEVISKWLCYSQDLYRISSGVLAPIEMHISVYTTECPGENVIPWIEGYLRYYINNWGS